MGYENVFTQTWQHVHLLLLYMFLMLSTTQALQYFHTNIEY